MYFVFNIFQILIFMMNKKLKFFGLFTLTLAGTLAFASCSDDDKDNTYNYESPESVTLSSHNWVTTNILDQDSLNVVLTDSLPQTYVGYSYFKSNGDFRIVDLNNNNKMYGQWMLYSNKNLRLNAFDSFNKVVAEDNREIRVLNDSVLVYRVRYDEKDHSKYLDIKQVPTTHVEPLTPAQVLTSNAQWTTSEIYNISSFYTGTKGDVSNNPIDPSKLDKVALDKSINDLTPLALDTLPQSNYAGDTNYGRTSVSSYFATTTIDNKDYYSNGKFTITEYEDPTKILKQGDWYVSLDGKYRTIHVVDNNKLTSSLVVSIAELTSTKFVYDVIDGDEVYRVINVPK